MAVAGTSSGRSSRGLGYRSTHEEWAFPRNLRKSAARRDWVNIAIIVLGWACYLVSACMASYAVFSIINNERIQESIASDVREAVKQWPADEQKSQYDAAVSYNNMLGDLSGKPLGDIVNPRDGATEHNTDETYMNALNVNKSGAMGVLSIPSISSDMTVYHTTENDVLSNGVGHVYGTYLPIESKGSLSALAAHSGGVNGLFFTRLQELRKGDYFYFTTLGKEQAYRVTDIDTVKPEELGDALKSKYDPSKTKMTLITCTPIGINTHRLLVTGELREVPRTAPAPSEIRDNRKFAIQMAVIVFIVFVLIAMLYQFIRHHRPGRYYLRRNDDPDDWIVPSEQ